MARKLLKLATPLTNGTIDDTLRQFALTCGPQTARTWIQSITLFGVPFNRWSTIHDNQPAEAGDRHCLSVSLTVPLVNGVADLSASSSSKVDTLNIWCNNCTMWQLHYTITETINTVLLVVNFLNRVATEVVLLPIVAFLLHLTFHN